MMRVLNEQHIAARRTRAARGSRSGGRRRERRPASRSGRAVAGTLRTALLVVVTVALAATLIVVLPELETVGGSDEPVIMHAAAPALPESGAGVVRLELTEDVEHFVADGETLSEIASAYDVGASTLAEYNGLRDPDTIVPGQRIVVPGPDSRRDLSEQE